MSREHQQRTANMKKTQLGHFGVQRSLVLATAVAAGLAAVSVLSPAAMAQQQVGTGGRALDASNRVGSGGMNDDSASALPPNLVNSAIVNGDITGGRQFRGGQSFDPGAFHGVLAGTLVSDFAAESTNVQTNGTIVNNAQNVHLFLGDNRGVNPPSNFISTGAQPGYVPAAAPSDSSFDSDSRLGTPSTETPLSSVVPSSIFQTGGAQAGGQSTYVTNSSLFGQRTLQNSQQNSGVSGVSNSDSLGAQPLNSALGSGDRIDLSAETRLQSLNGTTNADLTPANDNGLSGLGTPSGVASFNTPRSGSANANGTNSPGLNSPSNQPGQPGSQSANAGIGAAAGNGPNGTGLNGQSANGPVNAQIGGNSINAAVSAAVPSGYALNSSVGGNSLTGSINTGEDFSNNIYSPTSKLPGSAYQRMVQRLKAINPNAPLSPVERSLLNQAKNQDIKAAAANANPKQGVQSTPTNSKPAGASDVSPPGIGGAPATPPGSITSGSQMVPNSGLVLPQQVTSPTDRNKPVQLKSFSDDDQTSAGTRELLKKAEDLMRQGKFTSAIEQYDLVERQSPSQPYIQLARANAELGASYYGLANTHLRDALMTDQALLSAQLDLNSLLGQDKLQYLVKDLKQIAQANPTDSRAVFLLSYICYNTNNPRGAAAYLDLAEKREGKPDPFFRLLRQHWDLPDISGGGSDDTGLNK
jgi:tetratricopeptide (TPR) repeat protein